MTEHRTPATVLVPAAWRDELVLALRLRDVTGTRIGDVLAEVEEFCTDSGQDAGTAFGDPHEYAASLTASTDQHPARWGEDLRAAGHAVVGFVGLVTVLAVVMSEGPMFVVELGWLLGLPLMLGAAVLTIRVLGATADRRGWRAAIAPFAVVALTLVAVVVLGMVLDIPVATVPDWLALAVGATLLVGDAVVKTVQARRHPTADLVTGPGDDPAETARRNVRADVLAAWLLPGFALVGVALLGGLDALLG